MDANRHENKVSRKGAKVKRGTDSSQKIAKDRRGKTRTADESAAASLWRDRLQIYADKEGRQWTVKIERWQISRSLGKLKGTF
jgi:hypothetical protein